MIWCDDFTHFTRANRVAVAVIDVVSRKWLATLVSAEETSTQVEACFLVALAETGLDELLDARLLEKLRTGATEVEDLDHEQVPVLLAMSDSGPQMRSHTTREFMAACAIMQRFGRPSIPRDQAWIETLFVHLKGEWPHLEKVRDPGELSLELDRVRAEYNQVRPHAGIGYVTPRRRARRTRRATAPSQSRRTGQGANRTHQLPSKHTGEEP